MLYVLLSIIVVALAVQLYREFTTPARKVHDAAQSTVEDLAAKIVVDIGEKLDSLKEFDQLAMKRAQLEAELVALKMEKADITEVFERTRRDLEHEAGLLRKQLDHELAVVKQEAALDADRRVLAAERRFGEESLKAQTTAFEQRIKFIESYTNKLMDLVPKVEALVKLGGKGAGR